ncbi:hypothetical protein VQ044_13775 [Aurantimonas sp. C2-5-R2]|nr:MULTISPECIES: hypothetical protein [unclassified Aurantimonas]MEC5291710.1 hypothetical protein [Aurantimonas sp. C2-3-R2]MEC5412836.1 hypothetical protein [Aurantimonas sp. C2-4-R8]
MDYAETTASGNPVTVKRARCLPGKAASRLFMPKPANARAGTDLACHSRVTALVDDSPRKAKKNGMLETRSLSSCSL